MLYDIDKNELEETCTKVIDALDSVSVGMKYAVLMTLINSFPADATMLADGKVQVIE